MSINECHPGIAYIPATISKGESGGITDLWVEFTIFGQEPLRLEALRVRILLGVVQHPPTAEFLIMRGDVDIVIAGAHHELGMILVPLGMR